MTQGIKTGVTLSLLAVVLLVSAAVGWSKLTEPIPETSAEAAPEPCEDVDVRKGDPVRVGMVTVSVFNAGTRSGLATKTLNAFTDRGFGEGDTANADPDVTVKRAQVWTANKRDPAALLVRRHLGLKRTPLVVKPQGQLGEVGVTVVVGNDFTKLVTGPRRVVSRIKTTVCSPLPDPSDNIT